MAYKIIDFDTNTKYCTVAFDLTAGTFPNGRQNRCQVQRRIRFDDIQRTERELLTQLKKRLVNGEHRIPRSRIMTIQSVLEDYRTDQMRKGCHYCKAFDHKFKIIINYFGIDTPLEMLTRSRLKDFRQHLKETRNISTATINRYIAILRAAVNLAVEDEKIPDSPVKKFPMETETENPRRPFTPAEFYALINHLNPNHQDIFYTLLYTGIRLGRVLSLHWNQVDLISPHPRLTILKKNPRIKEGIPETFFITPSLFKILANRKAQSSSDYVFPNTKDPSRPLNSIKTSFKIARRKAGLSSDLTIHGLRHSFITGLNNQKVGLDTRQRLAGHSSLSMTEHYTHPNDSFLYEQTCKIENEFPHPLYGASETTN